MIQNMNEEDTLFNKFFIKDKDSKISFTVLSDKLNLDDESLMRYLTNKGLEINDRNGRKYLIGWKYRDDARTPAQSSNIQKSSFKAVKTVEIPNNSVTTGATEAMEAMERRKDEITSQEYQRQQAELEEYKRQLKLKNREIDNYKDLIKRHTREKLELEESHRNKLEELTEKVSLGHSLNERIQSILNRTKKDLERLSGKEVRILMLTDFHDNSKGSDGSITSKLHTRSYFVPKDQNYTFEIEHPGRNTNASRMHHNPDLRTHFM